MNLFECLREDPLRLLLDVRQRDAVHRVGRSGTDSNPVPRAFVPVHAIIRPVGPGSRTVRFLCRPLWRSLSVFMHIMHGHNVRDHKKKSAHPPPSRSVYQRTFPGRRSCHWEHRACYPTRRSSAPLRAISARQDSSHAASSAGIQSSPLLIRSYPPP
jgi:hypothetical protein